MVGFCSRFGGCCHGDEPVSITSNVAKIAERVEGAASRIVAATQCPQSREHRDPHGIIGLFGTGSRVERLDFCFAPLKPTNNPQLADVNGQGVVVTLFSRRLERNEAQGFSITHASVENRSHTTEPARVAPVLELGI